MSVDIPKHILGPGHKGGKGSLVNSKRKIVSWENSVKRDINLKFIFCLKINLSKFVKFHGILGSNFLWKSMGFCLSFSAFPHFFFISLNATKNKYSRNLLRNCFFFIIFLIWSRSIECQRTEWMMALINIIWELPFWSFDALKGN